MLCMHKNTALNYFYYYFHTETQRNNDGEKSVTVAREDMRREHTIRNPLNFSAARVLTQQPQELDLGTLFQFSLQSLSQTTHTFS